MQRPPSPDASQLIASSLAALNVAVLVLDREAGLVLANPAAQRLGLSSPIGGPLADPSQPSKPHQAVIALANQVTATGEAREIEIDLAPTTGGVPASIALRARLLPQGQVMVEAADVTEAHRLARTRRDFIANVSHELKTPVGALRLLADALIDASLPAAPGATDRLADRATDRLADRATDRPADRTTDRPADRTTDRSGGSAQLAADPPGGGRAAGPAEPRFADPEAIRRFAIRIQHESARLGRLVSELLELSRLLGAEPLPDSVPVAVDRIIAEVIDRSRTAAADHDTRLRYTGRRGLMVRGNETQLVTAVANLVENAIAYSPPSTNVTITVGVAGKYVTIAVADEGIGIAGHHLDRIFERFYRVDKARTRATGGTGLGLSIVKHIAVNHAGSVEVTSTVGEGSTFTLRLPAQPARRGGSAKR